ncbi:hypothetical protein [Agrobacterium deltaense]|nr:hypothetical protein [Agrobacterium deltaense]
MRLVACGSSAWEWHLIPFAGLHLNPPFAMEAKSNDMLDVVI